MMQCKRALLCGGGGRGGEGRFVRAAGEFTKEEVEEEKSSRILYCLV